MNNEKILIGHGAGGKLTHNLIENIFLKYFKNEYLTNLGDSSVIATTNRTAFTTDSYVIDPIIFNGGNIGHLAVSGTVNDLLVSGATPKFLSAGFIIEEGLPIKTLELIVESMALEAEKAGVKIITGDTKVVKKGQCDKIFINTAGIGEELDNAKHLSAKASLSEGDKIISSGYLGDHAITILAARNNITFETPIKSDVAPLNSLILPIIDKFGQSIKFMRDITRGGIATILNEVCNHHDFGIQLNEADIPVRKEVQGICEIFGYDPLYLANEGKVLIIAAKDKADEILEEIKNSEPGKDASIVGEITNILKGKVSLESVVGGSRIVDMLTGEMLPRIC